MAEGLVEFHTPVQFNEFLSRAGLVDYIYRAMSSPDVSDVVMTVLDVMKRANSMPRKVKLQKTAETSTRFRNDGNVAYSKSKYQEAFVNYNMALLFAPNNSRELKLAYSNRSALLYKLKAFSKCIKDIEMVFKLGVPDDIKDKIRQRYLEAKSCLWIEHVANSMDHQPFSKAYFEFNVRKNPQIQSASTDVGVIVENKVPKIVATNNVKVGVVLAIERAFVSMTATRNHRICCYYCQKFDLNLMPCTSCCVALFCSEECRQICLKEYHSIECQVMDMLEIIANRNMSTPRIAVKAVLKMMYLSKHWKEFVAESQPLGLQRMKESSINKIYDVNYKYSLLNSKDTRHFVYGALYNASILCAATIHTLESVALFPQKPEDSDAVKRAFARAYMHMYLHCGLTEMVPPISCDKQERTQYYEISNFAWFSLLGKLNHSCRPNCCLVNLNKSMALVATQPIKLGEELTVSYVDPWHHTDPKVRQQLMLGLHGNVCRCSHCKTPKRTPLNAIQRQKFEKLDLEELLSNYNPSTCPQVFQKTCRALTFLSTAPISEEYIDTYSLFRRCLLYFQDCVCENELLDYMET